MLFYLQKYNKNITKVVLVVDNKKMKEEREKAQLAGTIWAADNITPDQAKRHFKKLFPGADTSKFDFSAGKSKKKFSN